MLLDSKHLQLFETIDLSDGLCYYNIVIAEEKTNITWYNYALAGWKLQEEGALSKQAVAFTLT